jgi:PST family polysaccharide transporter
MSALYLGFVTLLSEFGIGMSVVVLRDLSEDQIARLAGVSVVIGVLCFLLSIPAAHLVAWFFQEPELAPVIIVMSISFVFLSFRTISASLLQRDLHFRTLALLEAFSALIQSGFTVVLALLGFGYWTLVLGSLVGSAVQTGSALALSPHRFAWPRRGAMRRPLTFSFDVLTSRIAWYIYTYADVAVAGRLLGKYLLGAYSIAWNFASLPVEKVSALVMQVTPSVLAAVRQNKADLRRYLLTLTEGIALLAFPAAIGLGLEADRFVIVALTDKYAAAIAPLRILAFYAVVRSVSPLFPPVLTALSVTRPLLWNGVLAVALLPAAFVVGSRWGIVGIASAWALVHPIVVLNIARQALPAIELPVRGYLQALWPAASSCAVMAAVVLALRYTLPDHFPLALRFAIESLAGAFTYGAVLLTVHRDRFDRFRTFLKGLRSQQPV